MRDITLRDIVARDTVTHVKRYQQVSSYDSKGV